MTDDEPTRLSPAEAGAIVAQWAETHPVDLSDLAKKLELEDANAQSLLRQAKGRVAMENWSREHRRAPIRSSNPFLWAGGGVLVAIPLVLAIQALVARSRPTPPPTETLRGPTSSTMRNLMKFAPGVNVQQNGESARFEAERLGTMVANLTTGAPPKGSPPIRMTVPPSKSHLLEVPVGAPRIAEPVQPKMPQHLTDIDMDQFLHSHVPPDMTLEILTGKYRYFRKGIAKKDIPAAAHLREADVIGPLHDMLQVVFKREFSGLTAGATGGDGARLVFLIGIGRAHSMNQIVWNEDNRALVSKMANSEKEPFYGMLVAPVLERIHMLGPNLFESL